jgi:hypothetical protein
MIKPGALVMAVLMAAVTAGTYYGLDFLPKGFLPGPLGRTPPPEPPKVGASQGSTPAAGAAATPEAAPAPAAKSADQPVTEQDLAEEPPPPQQAAAASPPPPATPAAEPAPAPAEKPAAHPAPAPAPAERPAPAEKSAAADTPEPGWGKEKPAPAAAAPAPKEEPTTTATAESATVTAEPDAGPGPVKPHPPEADVIKPWWPNPDKMPPNQLKLQYAGQVQGEQAIALLFTAPVNIDSVKKYAKIQAGSGATAGGQWEVGKNPRLAVFRGLKPGRYTVILSPEIADAKGFMLGTTLQGPVYIQGK